MNSTLKILAEEVDEINIAKLIYNISLTMDKDYDIQCDFEDKILSYVKEIKNIQENILKKQEYLDLCKKYRLKKYSHLNEYELYQKLSLFLFNKKKDNSKLNKDMKRINDKVMQKIKNYIDTFPNGDTNEIKIKKMLHILEILKYLSNYKFFIMINPMFDEMVISKLLEFKPDFEEYSKLNKDFLKYESIIKSISVFNYVY